MQPRDIIAKAWAITKKEKDLRIWGFSGALLKTLLNAKLFLFQAWLIYSYFILKNPIGFFTIEKTLIENLPLAVAISIIVFFFLLLFVEWLFPHMAKGAIIGLAAKSYKKEDVKGGLVLAIYNFFPLFAIHEMLVLSSITTTITLCSLSLRYGGGAGPIAVMLLVTFWLVSNILEFFWIFAEEAVVVKKIGIREAVKQSFKLVISYLGHVVFLMLLLFVIALRIIANLLMVILIPGIVLGLGFLLATFLPPVVSYSVTTVLGLVIIVLASYLFAYLEVFRQTVWTITYMELSQLKDLDVIEKDDE
ncbi:hypothetical protein COU78_04235 [Candidatus Peregrinibacteria bacterium CG10_big_fil_rev_8_21_14_0_10_49_24]|nr:MAG: hypothetical protein COV83_00770 [Candidatus Peregrinibacteria bacterium CG11_big_fil_rev_8_21_14_0_20_49_14]PIR50876.1 MAG: hypothetical protein COU78_04235 [Candidatus Peregrinibacteria bacterium CG10_big_fil_rev_8_21_14_0_10_49_24]PJA67153.1 MAG: hypothetical protein CO157_06165 [Candidatus Peregrinibacteria bacterium CG_4_9_14_3_um_filter_49_12]